jgi:hypothetical protein
MSRVTARREAERRQLHEIAEARQPGLMAGWAKYCAVSDQVELQPVRLTGTQVISGALMPDVVVTTPRHQAARGAQQGHRSHLFTPCHPQLTSP